LKVSSAYLELIIEQMSRDSFGGQNTNQNEYLIILCPEFKLKTLVKNPCYTASFRQRMLCQRSQCSGQYMHQSFIQEESQVQVDLCRSFSVHLSSLHYLDVQLQVCLAQLLCLMSLFPSLM